MTDTNCEYFIVRYRKTSPSIGSWQTLPNLTSNEFSLTLDNSSTYEIEAVHRCCNGGDSLPTTISYNTGLGTNLIYITLSEQIQSDTCSTNTSTCRTCQIVRQYKLNFFSDEACTIPITPPANMNVRLQDKKTGTYSQTPYSVIVNTSTNEYVLFSKVASNFICNNGNQVTEYYELTVLDGLYEQQPYRFIKKPANSPSLVEISNTNTGPGGTRTQTFKVGEDVIEDNKYTFGVYGVIKSYTATYGDTSRSIAFNIAYIINSMTEQEWRAQNSAPPSGTQGFKPSATWDKNNVIITLNYQNQFFGSASPI